MYLTCSKDNEVSNFIQVKYYGINVLTITHVTSIECFILKNSTSTSASERETFKTFRVQVNLYYQLIDQYDEDDF
jgi:hypothetical protein